MYDNSAFSQKRPVRVGFVGTGYAAVARAQALLHDKRSHLVAVVGHTPEKTEAFAKNYQMMVVDSWQQLVEQDNVDLIVICTVTRDHGTIARKALASGKHVVVEYPLSLDVAEAQELIVLAKTQKNSSMLNILNFWVDYIKP